MVKLKGEQIGWGVSAALHIVVVAVIMADFGGFTFFADDDYNAPPPAIDIEFERIAEKTQVVAPEPAGEKEPAVQAKSSPAVQREEYSEPEAADAVPLLDDIPTPAAAKPEPPKKPTVSELQKLAAKVTPRSKPKPPSRLRNISAVIDRALKEEQQQVRANEAEEEEEAAPDNEAEPDPLAGLRGRFATASLRDALSQKLSGCWTFPRGAKGVADMRVTVRISLRPDGTLSRPPEYIGVRGLDNPENAFFRTFAESARRAVVLCEPYQEEAAILFKNGQSYIDFNFSGREFSGG